MEIKLNKEFLVYAIDILAVPANFDKGLGEITKKEFIKEAVRQGYIYTLSEFEKGFNKNVGINQDTMFIRIYD